MPPEHEIPLEALPSGVPASHKHLPPALWAVLVLPFGLTVGYATLTMPFVLKARGFDMTSIGAVAFVCQLPHTLKLFWAPALDAGWPRKRWFYAMLALNIVSLAATMLIPPSKTDHAGPFTFFSIYAVVLTVAQFAAATSSSAVLALLAIDVPKEFKGRASGWQTAGNLVGTFAGGAALIACIVHLGNVATALVVVLVLALSAIPAMILVEPTPKKHVLRKLMGDLLGDVWALIRSRPGWTGLIICLSPVGTGALLNLASALVTDYEPEPHRREHLAVVVTGVAGGLINGAGSLVGGYLCDLMNRRVAYMLFGGVTALVAVGMLLAPATPSAFTVGCLAYSFANGLCYAAFYAFVLEMIGASAGVTTQLAIFIGASNLAISYVTWLDGAAYDWAARFWPHHLSAGRQGLCGMDAGSTFVGIAVILVMTTMVARWGRRPGSTAAA